MNDDRNFKKEEMRPETWLKALLLLICAILAALSFVAYLVDPYMQYRVRDGAYFMNGWMSSPGLIKNYEYDTLILGSSMTQNFNMDTFRAELGVEPLHIGIGGVTQEELLELAALARSTGKVARYYICTDPYLFAEEEKENRLPQYLIKEDPLSRVRYFLGYEAWFRFMPTDLAIAIARKAGMRLPEKVAYRTSVDRLENNTLDFTFDADVVTRNVRLNLYGVSDVDTEGLYQRMTRRADEMLQFFDDEDADVVFFFPPYSALYWCYAQANGYYETYQDAKRYFIEQAVERGRIVYDFQPMDCVSDLDNYKDMTHYSPEISDRMTRCFASETWRATPQTFSEMQTALNNQILELQKKYPQIFD